MADIFWPFGTLGEGTFTCPVLATETNNRFSPKTATATATTPGFATAYPGYPERTGYPGYPGFGYPFASMIANQLQGVCVPVDHSSLLN